MITIKHAEHGTIEKMRKLQCPKGLKGGPMEHTIKTYKLLYQFLTQNLIEKEFEDKEQLQEVLTQWPLFLQDKKFVCDAKFSKIHISGNHIACIEDLGWELILGNIREL